jgi:hypothetical protein
LRLEPAQRQRIEQILKESQERLHTSWQQIAPQFREELQNTHEKIKTELSPNQRVKFEEISRTRGPRRLEDQPGPEPKRDRLRNASPTKSPTGAPPSRVAVPDPN